MVARAMSVPPPPVLPVIAAKRTVHCNDCSRQFVVDSEWPPGTSGLYRYCMKLAELRGWKWHVTGAGLIVYTCTRCLNPTTEKTEHGPHRPTD